MPDWKAYVRAHLPPLEIRAEREAEIVDELALQLEASYDAALHGGATSDEAAARALAEVPDWRALARSLTEIEQPHARSADIASLNTPAPFHAQRGGLMSGLVQDARFARRALARTPGFTAVAIFTLALGLALGAVAIAVIDGVLIRPLPYPDADRLVLVRATVPPEGRLTDETTLHDAVDLAAERAIFQSAAMVLPYAATTTLTDPPFRLEGFEIAGSLFSTLRQQLPLGRDFTPSDGRAGAAAVAIIGYGFWERLGSPPDVVGRTIVLNDIPRTIVGVAPRAFRFELLGGPGDVFVPITPAHPFAQSRNVRTFRTVARLADDVTIDQANAAVATIGARLAQAFPATNQGRTFTLAPLQEHMVGPVRRPLTLVATLVALVLVVGGVNLAGLLLARAVARARDVSVRVALGASRWRLTREALVEACLLAVPSAAGGILLAHAALSALRAAPGATLPRLAELAMDGRSIAAVGIVAMLVTAAVALAPFAVVRRLHTATDLRSGRETAGRLAGRIRSALVTAQTAVAFVLLAAAALLAAGLFNLLRQPLGFETSRIVTMRISIPATRYPTLDDTRRFYRDIVESIRAHRGVEGAGVVSHLPLSGSSGSGLLVQGREAIPAAMRPTVGWQWAGAGYFEAMGMRVVRGRGFSESDLQSRQHVTVINETLARLHFPGEDPIGRRVHFGAVPAAGPADWHEVIGIVADVRHQALDAAPDARAYDLFGQHWGRTVSLAVRTAANTTEIAGFVRRVVAARDPQLAVFAVRTTADLVNDAAATRRLLVWIVAAFAATGLILTVVGLYGTVAYMVAGRSRELGVRVALGATSGDVRRLVIAYGARHVAAGLALGAAGAWLLRGIAANQLSGAPVNSAAILIASAAAVTVAGLLACVLPARRAASVDPAQALRAE